MKVKKWDLKEESLVSVPANPIVFDDVIINTPLVSNELRPLIKPISPRVLTTEEAAEIADRIREHITGDEEH